MPIEQLPPSNFDLKIIPDAAAQIRTATDMGLASIESSTQITQTIELNRIDPLTLADLSSTWSVLRAEGNQYGITYPKKSGDLFRRKDITTTIAYSSIVPTLREEVAITNGKRVTETVPGFSMLVRSIDDEALLEVVDLPDTVVWNNQSCTAEYNSQTDQVVYVDSQGTIQVVADGRVYRTPTGEIVSLTPTSGDYSSIHYNILGTGGETDQKPNLASDVITQTTNTDSMQLLTVRGGTAMNIVLPPELVDRFPKSLFSMDLSAMGDADGNIQIGSTLPGFERILGSISPKGRFSYKTRIVTASVLNVREGTSTTVNPLGQVPRGTELPILRQSTDKKWALVSWTSLDGEVREAWIAEGPQYSEPNTVEYKPPVSKTVQAQPTAGEGVDIFQEFNLVIAEKRALELETAHPTFAFTQQFRDALDSAGLPPEAFSLEADLRSDKLDALNAALSFRIQQIVGINGSARLKALSLLPPDQFRTQSQSALNEEVDIMVGSPEQGGNIAFREKKVTLNELLGASIVFDTIDSSIPRQLFPAADTLGEGISLIQENDGNLAFVIQLAKQSLMFELDTQFLKEYLDEHDPNHEVAALLGVNPDDIGAIHRFFGKGNAINSMTAGLFQGLIYFSMPSDRQQGNVAIGTAPNNPQFRRYIAIPDIYKYMEEVGLTHAAIANQGKTPAQIIQSQLETSLFE